MSRKITEFVANEMQKQRVRNRQRLFERQYGKTDASAVTAEDVQRAADPKIRYYDPLQKPFTVYGLILPGDTEEQFCRIPTAVAETVSEGVKALYRNTAGGRIRFRTDSRRLSLKVFYPQSVSMGHFAQSGVSGFSVYVDQNGEQVFAGLLTPDRQTEFEGSVDLQSTEMKEITIYMPLYNGVVKVFVGLDAAAQVCEDSGYAYEKPVVFYGSSITQGGCASRPGADYTAILSRRLRFDYVNLGFSGNAKGERAMAEHIRTLPMQAFVMDYDHNAPTPEFLAQTHEPFFRVIRDACPELPVVFISRPDSDRNDDNRKRFAVIQTTYENALRRGDKRVYLIDGATFFDEALEWNDPTVDHVHPTDLGFYLMAQKIGPVLKTILQDTKESRDV